MSGLERVWIPARRVYRSRNVACAGCGGDLPLQTYQGNPRRWCSETCRVRAWRRRKATA